MVRGPRQREPRILDAMTIAWSCLALDTGVATSPLEPGDDPFARAPEMGLFISWIDDMGETELFDLNTNAGPGGTVRAASVVAASI